MCQTFSGWVRRDKSIVFVPELTDSHSEMLEAGLVRVDENMPSGIQNVAKWEYTPSNGDYADLDSYVLKIDEYAVPVWLDAAAQHDLAATLREKVAAMIVSEGDKPLLGGCWIVCGNATVRWMRNSRVVSVSDSGSVGSVYGSGRVGYDATHKDVCRGARQARVYTAADHEIKKAQP